MVHGFKHIKEIFLKAFMKAFKKEYKSSFERAYRKAFLENYGKIFEEVHGRKPTESETFQALERALEKDKRIITFWEL